MTVRKIPPNRRSITGHVPSKKKPGMLAFESKLERDFYILLEFDDFVSRLTEQPLQIPFIDRRGRLNKYTPDCEIEYIDSEQRAPTIVELKYRADLFQQWPILHPKLLAAARYAKNRGYGFRIITEREIQGPRLENARWLIAYRSMPIPPDEVEAMTKALSLIGGYSTPTNLLDRIASTAEHREELLVTLWYAIANKHVMIDMDSRLTMRSRIWIPA